MSSNQSSEVINLGGISELVPIASCLGILYENIGSCCMQADQFARPRATTRTFIHQPGIGAESECMPVRLVCFRCRSLPPVGR